MIDRTLPMFCDRCGQPLEVVDGYRLCPACDRDPCEGCAQLDEAGMCTVSAMSRLPDGCCMRDGTPAAEPAGCKMRRGDKCDSGKC